MDTTGTGTDGSTGTDAESCPGQMTESTTSPPDCASDGCGCTAGFEQGGSLAPWLVVALLGRRRSRSRARKYAPHP
jgi:MYXO-CTERM domain-containing protein